jgi:Fic family protein
MEERMLFLAPTPTGREEAVLAEIQHLRDQLRAQLVEPRRWHGSLRRQSMARAVQASNSIEGYDAALDDVVAIAVDETPIDASTLTALAHRGYGHAMTYVLQMADDPAFAFSSQLMKSLHFMMLAHDLEARPGRWRAGPILVRDDRGGIVYEGPDVATVPGLMDELIEMLDTDDGSPAIVRAAMAHLNLVMIHPFRDGNGRMARCLQSLVLVREGILAPEFSSVEEYLGRNTPAYYAVLAEVGGGRWSPDRDARPWLRFMLTAHLRQARTLLRRVRESEQLAFQIDRLIETYGLPERTQHALFDAAIGMRVRNTTYRTLATRSGDPITFATASRDLRQLVTAELLQPHGERRGRHYTAGPTLGLTWRAILATRDPRDDADPFAGERPPR